MLAWGDINIITKRHLIKKKNQFFYNNITKVISLYIISLYKI